jgi:superfamily II DNA or RNA helicase
MLGIAIRRLWGVQQRSGSTPFNHYRSLATTSRYRPVPKLNTVLPRWHSSAAVEALRAVDSQSTIPSREEEIISPSVVLRPYQEDAITSCLEALSSGLTRIGVSSPTGSGKTTMFMSLIPKVADQGERTRTLILVSSVDLASQAEGAARRMLGPGYRIEVEQGKRIASGTADV